MSENEKVLAFALNARLTKEFGSTFNSANNQLAGFNDKILKLDQDLASTRGVIKARQEVDEYQKKFDELNSAYKKSEEEGVSLQSEIARLTSEYEKAKKELKKYERQINKSDQVSDEMIATYEKQEQSVRELSKELKQASEKEKTFSKTLEKSKAELEKSKNSVEKKKESLSKLESQLGTTNIKIDSLIEREKRLSFQTEKWNKIAARSAKASAKISGGFENITAGAATLGSLYGTVAGTIGKPIKDSMALEDAMADLAKVSDLSEQGLADMQKRLERMSLSIPMTASGLAQIAAAAAGAGVESKDLAEFTEQAAKMAVAFDITADSAGTMMSKWQSGMKLTLPQTFALADAVNGLSNSNAALAADIGDAMQRYGALGKVAGLTETQTAALATSLIASGASSDTAATGMKAFMGALAKGGTMAELQAAAFTNIGFDPKELQASLQKDAPKTIVSVLEAINKKIPPEKRTMYLNAMFGETGMEAIGPLLQNLEGLKKNFDLVADAQGYAGSMEKEFAARSKTTSNALQLVQNAAASVSRSIGEPLLEPLREAASMFVRFADSISGWLKENPEFVKSAVYAGLAVTAVAGAVSAGSILIGAMTLPIALATKSFAGLQKIVWGLSNFGFNPLIKTVGLVKNSFSAIGAVASVGGKGILSMGSAISKVGTALRFAFMNPVGLAVGAVATLAYGGYQLYKNWDAVSAYFRDNFPGAMKVASAAVSWLGDGASWLSDRFGAVTAFLQNTFLPAWSNGWNSAVSIATNIWSGIQSAIDKPIDAMVGGVNSLIAKVNEFSFTNPFTGKTVGLNIPYIGKPSSATAVASSAESASSGNESPKVLTPMPMTTRVSQAAPVVQPRSDSTLTPYPELKLPTTPDTPPLPAFDVGEDDGTPILNPKTTSLNGEGTTSGRPSTTFNFAPVINVQGGDSTVEERIRKALEEGQRKFEQNMQAVLDRNMRVAY